MNPEYKTATHEDEVHLPEKSKIEQLRELVATESAKPVEAAVVPLVYRDDYGRVISQRQYETLQRHKLKAKESGYEIDEYSQ